MASGDVLGTSTTTSGSTGGGGGGGGDETNQGNLLSRFPGYAGWDPAAAWGDYLATGGSGKGGGGVPSIDPILEEINRLYSGTGDYLNQAESNLRGDYPNVLSEATNQFNVSKGTLDTSRTQADRQLSESEVATNQRKIDAENAARRLYAEMRQGGIQRFGGASSAGQAYNDLMGVEAQRSNAGIQRDFGTASREIESQRMAIGENYQNTLLQLEQNKQNAVNNAQRDFQAKLLEISRLRTESEQAKSQMKIQALSELRNQIFQVQLQNQQFQQELKSQASNSLSQLQAAQSQLGSSVGQGQTAMSTFSNQSSTNPQTQLSFGQSQGSSNPFLQGAITGRRPDERDQFGLIPGLTSFTQQ